MLPESTSLALGAAGAFPPACVTSTSAVSSKDSVSSNPTQTVPEQISIGADAVGTNMRLLSSNSPVHRSSSVAGSGADGFTSLMAAMHASVSSDSMPSSAVSARRSAPLNARISLTKSL